MAHTSTSVSKTFAERLSDLVAEEKESGVQIRELADKIGIGAGSLSQYQNDFTTASIEALYKIAKYFNVSADYLLGLTHVRTGDKDIREVCDYTGMSEEAIESIVQSREDHIFVHTLNYLIESKALISAIAQYYVSFVAEKLTEEPYCYLPLCGQVPDRRLALADLLDLLPEDRENFMSKCDDGFIHSAIFNYVKKQIDVFACMRILDGEAFMVSASSEKEGERHNINRVLDIPNEENMEELSDFEKALIISQMNLIPTQKSVIRECIETAKIDISDQMVELIAGINKLRLGGAQHATD